MTYAAIFIDFENIYFTLKNPFELDSEADHIVLELLTQLKKHVEERDSATVIVQRAYADFARTGDNQQRDLYLLGIRPSYIAGTDHKNAADMLLCTEMMEVLYTKPEISRYYLVSGDRDYIPVVSHLVASAKSVRVCAFRENAARDMVNMVGEEGFLDLKDLLSSDVRERLSRPKKAHASVPPVAKHLEPAKPPPPRSEPVFAEAVPLTAESEREALQILLNEFKHSEIYIMPFLYRLERDMPWLDHSQRKRIISTFKDAGVVAIEKKQGEDRFTGEPNTYSVMIVNHNHPTVRELHPGADLR
jgi:uncharacterized LabA/DUF88 family protein